jgi:hypothetical protein
MQAPIKTSMQAPVQPYSQSSYASAPTQAPVQSLMHAPVQSLMQAPVQSAMRTHSQSSYDSAPIQAPAATKELDIADQVFNLAKAHALQQAQMQADDQAKTVSKSIFSALTATPAPTPTLTSAPAPTPMYERNEHRNVSEDLEKWGQHLEQSIPKQIYQVLEEQKRVDKERNANQCLEEITHQLQSIPFEISTRIIEAFEELLETTEDRLYARLQDELSEIRQSIENTQISIMMMMEEIIEKVDKEDEIKHEDQGLVSNDEDDGIIIEKAKVTKSKTESQVNEVEPAHPRYISDASHRALFTTDSSQLRKHFLNNLLRDGKEIK